MATHEEINRTFEECGRNWRARVAKNLKDQIRLNLVITVLKEKGMVDLPDGCLPDVVVDKQE